MKRKESEFALALQARDEVVREKEEIERQMDLVKVRLRNRALFIYVFDAYTPTRDADIAL